MLTPSPDPSFPASDTDWEQVARYIAGELEPVQAAQLRTRIAADPSLATLVSAIEGTSLFSRVPSQADVEAALARAHARMHLRAVDGAQSVRIPRTRIEHPARVRSFASGWLAAAAAIPLIIGAAWFTNRAPQTQAVPQVTARVFATQTGARDSVVLGDGSRVVLGPASEIRWSETSNGAREVALKGEARFDVVHDAARPFAVRTAEAVVRDIGTSFTVHSYAGGGADIAVQEGAVDVWSVHDTGSVIALHAGQVASIDARGVLTKLDRPATSEDLVWLQGRLLFRAAPMVKVRADLRRRYGIELVTTDSAIANSHVTASFQSESRQQVLDILALALGAKYEARGDTVVLRKAGSPAPAR